MFMIHDKAILSRTSAECFSEPECENKCSTSYEQQCSTRNEQQCSTGNVDDNYGYFYHCPRENLDWRPIKLRRISNFHPLVWKRLTQLLKSLSLVTFFCPLVVTTQALFGLTLTRGLMFRYCAAKKRFCTNLTFCTFLHRLVASKMQTGCRYYRHVTLRIGIAGSRKADLSSVML